MFHFGPQATMPFSAAYGAGYSPRESFGSVSPRGMLTSPRSGLSARPQSSHRMNPGDLKEMFLMNNTKGTVDAHAFWDRHVALTNMRQSFAASRGFSRESSPRPATAQAGHLSPRNRVRTTGRALGDTFGAGPAEWAGAIEEGLGRSFVHSEQAPSMTGTPTRKPVGSSAPKKFTLPAGVSLEELQSSHDQIKEKLLSKYGSFTRAFRSIDEDGSGLIERHEFERMMRSLNLDGIRQPIILCLLDMMDYDDDDDGETGYDIKYEEFVHFLAADDIKSLFPDVVALKRDHKMGFKKKVVAEKTAALVQRTFEKPVTATELHEAHKMIQENILMRHGYFGKAFKFMDQDRTGLIDKEEFKLAVKFMNLDTHIRRPAIDALLALIDQDKAKTDKSGVANHEIEYHEFAKYMSSETLLDVATDERIEQAMRKADSDNRDEVNKYNEEMRRLHTGAPATAPPQRPMSPRQPEAPKSTKRLTPRQRAALEAEARGEAAPRTRSATPRARGRGARGKAGTSAEWNALKRSANAAMKGPGAGVEVQGDGYVKAKLMDIDELGFKDPERLKDILPEGLTAKELKRALKMINAKMKDKFQRMSSAFKNIDKDRSGHLERDEIAFVLKEDFNLNLRDVEIQGVLNLMDVDKSGTIEYTEFARVITAGDVETTWQERLARNDKDLNDGTDLRPSGA